MKYLFRVAAAAFLAAQTQAAPTLTDFWDGKAAWVKKRRQNRKQFWFPLCFDSSGRRFAGLLHPQLHGGGREIQNDHRARVGTDGINWTNDGMVLDVSRAAQGTNRAPLWDDRLTSFPEFGKMRHVVSGV